ARRAGRREDRRASVRGRDADLARHLRRPGRRHRRRRRAQGGRVSAPWAVIARREFLERVRTKWFVIGTLLGPIGMIALIVIPAVLASMSAEGVRIKVVDHSGRELGPIVATTLGVQPGWKVENVAPPPDPENQPLRDEIAADKIDGFIVIPPDVLTGGVVTYQGDNATNQNVYVSVLKGVNQAVIGF